MDDETKPITPTQETSTTPAPLPATGPRQNRRCRDCKACCTTHVVSALDKPGGVACAHLCKKGCSIQETKPQQCIEFKCLWLLGASSDKDRPDKLGIVMDMQENKRYGRMYKLFEVIEGAMNRPHAQIIGRQLAAQGLVILFRKNGQRAVLGGPDEMVAKFRADVQLAVVGGPMKGGELVGGMSE